jgi:hypothetical protein
MQRKRLSSETLHLSKINDLFLSSRGVNFDNSQRCADTQTAIQNVHTEDDGISLSESRNRLETAGPNCLRSRVLPLCFDNLFVVGLERIEEMVNDVGYVTKSMNP